MDMNGLILVWKTDSCKKVIEIQGPEEPEWMKFHPRVENPSDASIIGQSAARRWKRFQYLVLAHSGWSIPGRRSKMKSMRRSCSLDTPIT